MGKTVYIGSYVHSLSLTELEQVEHAIIAVGEGGTIEWIEHAAAEQVQNILARHGLGIEDVELVELGPDDFLCPGLIDTHTVSCSATDARSLSRSGVDQALRFSTHHNSRILV